MPVELRIRPFQPADILAVNPQAGQLGDFPSVVDLGTGRALAEHFAITGLLNDHIIGCAGIAEVWSNRAIGWAFFSGECGRFMLPITRLVRDALDLHASRRIETTVLVEFPAGRRWAELLGFHLETPEPMRCFAGDRAAWLYSRIKGDG